MVVLHAKPVRPRPAARRNWNIVGGVKVHLAFKHSRRRISGELIRDDRIGGERTVDENEAAETERQQIEFAYLHFLFLQTDLPAAHAALRCKRSGSCFLIKDQFTQMRKWEWREL